MSQLSPLNPATHVHSYLFTRSLHEPPFLHWLLKHSLTSVPSGKRNVEYYETQNSTDGTRAGCTQ
jgi:hypothetical protein